MNEKLHWNPFSDSDRETRIDGATIGYAHGLLYRKKTDQTPPDVDPSQKLSTN